MFHRLGKAEFKPRGSVYGEGLQRLATVDSLSVQMRLGGEDPELKAELLCVT